MKKIYLLFFLGSACLCVTAQPVISTPPQIGDEVTSEFAYTTGIQPGAAGANISWDYSNLIDSASTGTIKFVSAGSTPYKADFPGAEYAAVIGDTLFSYYKMVSGVPAIMGLESSNTKFVYARPTSVLQYPFTYPDTFNDSVTLFLEKPFAGKTKLLDTILVTGYGTLKLPGKTYNNVLQVRQINATSGTIELPLPPPGNSFTVPPTLDTSYAYYIDGEPAPLLSYGLSNGSIEVITYLKSSTVMPLHFISFTALPGDGSVQLNWQTGDESNTNVFYIQRSTDASVFSNIGKVAAGGSGSHSYSFNDAMLGIAPVLYYRLQETDLDGRSTYSDIVACNLSGFAGITLFPNPASSNITIMGTRNYSSLRIYNLTGQQLEYRTITGESITVPVTKLSAGVYIAELSDGTKTMQLRFLKR